MRCPVLSLFAVNRFRSDTVVVSVRGDTLSAG
jgi:hypothetical protein